MKTKGRRVLQMLAKVVASTMVITVMGQTSNMTTYAEEDTVLLNAGVAEIMDTIDVEVVEDVAAVNETRGIDEEEQTEEAESNQSSLVMADVDNYLNVREEASEEATVAGMLYADCGGEILEQEQGWTKIQSGNLVGWAKDEYLLFDEEAMELAEESGTYVATVQADALHVRKEPNEDAGVYGNIANGEEHSTLLEENTDEWYAIEYKGDVGYISADYVSVEFDIAHGETIEEIEERERQEKLERAKLIANQGAVAVGTTDDVLLAALVQCEAGGESYEGQLGVAAVVMNRVRSGAYPNTIAAVVYAPGQFTPAGSGSVEARVNAGVSESCLQAARAAINGETTVGAAMHFRRIGYTEGVEIGNHVFW